MHTDTYHQAMAYLHASLHRNTTLDVTYDDGSRLSGFLVELIDGGFHMERRNVRRGEDGHVIVGLASVFELVVHVPGEDDRVF
jgi:hypothetical protein